MSPEPVTHETTRQDSERRLEELVLYVAQRCAYDPRFGATKLNKTLFYADFMAYANLGRPITGAAYRKLPHGPAPRTLPRVRKSLIDSGRAALQTATYHGKKQKRLVPLAEPEIDSFFTATEIAIVEEVLRITRDHNATELSELSHDFKGWEYALDDEDIPYETVFLADGPPVLTPEEEQFGQMLAQQIG